MGQDTPNRLFDYSKSCYAPREPVPKSCMYIGPGNINDNTSGAKLTQEMIVTRTHNNVTNWTNKKRESW